MTQLTINFNNKTVIIEAIEQGGVAFYDLNKIWSASSEMKHSKRPNQWRNKLSKRYEEEGKKKVFTGVCNGNLKNETTFGTEEVVKSYCQWLESLSDKPKVKEFVYVIGLDLDKDDEHYLNHYYQVAKIGVSSNVEERLKQLQTGSFMKLKVLGSVEVEDAYGYEKFLHEHLAHNQSPSMNEWFLFCDEELVEAVIKQDHQYFIDLKKADEDDLAYVLAWAEANKD